MQLAMQRAEKVLQFPTANLWKDTLQIQQLKNTITC
jgi:hypothetical protein